MKRGRKKLLDETKLIELIAEGHASKQIADMMNASPGTIEKWRTQVMHELDCKNAAHLVSYAYKVGILQI